MRVNAAASLVISGDAPKSANLLRRLHPTVYKDFGWIPETAGRS